MLLNKLPGELRLIISRKVSEGDWNFNNLYREIERDIEARERAQATPGNMSQSTSIPPTRRTREPQTAARLLTGGTPTVVCSFCQQAHSSTTCKTVAQIDARTEILRKSGRCLSCLRRGHLSQECRSKSRCSKCGGRHHIAICPPHHPSHSMCHHQVELLPTLHNHRRLLNPNAASFMTPTTTSLLIGIKKTVMLQTVRAMIYNPTAPHSSLQVTMVLDSGSQRSYITHGVKEALALEAEGEQLTSIVAFGSNEPSTQKCMIVRVGMSLHDSPNQELQLFAVPSICGHLTAQPILLCVTEYDHLSPLELADSSDDLSIDILIGADHYWDILTGEIKRRREGPIAIRTKLRWVLLGPASRIEPTPCLHNLFITHALHVGHRESDNASGVARSR